MTTIYDIAKAAGVSPTTVSRVLNNYPDVSAKTKEKITKTMKELDYIPSTSARSLSTKRSYLIGVLFDESLNVGIKHPYFAGVIEGFKTELAIHGYDTMFIVNKLGNKQIGYLQHCKIRGVDGVCFFANDEDDENIKELVNSDIKSVTTDLSHEKVPRICSDNEEGSRLVMEHYFKNNHEHIGVVMGPLHTKASVERLEGVKKIYQTHQKDFDEHYVVVAEDYHIQGGYEAAKKLFESVDESNQPTAIYAGSDILAVGVLKYLREINKQIPDDVELIGFDNIELTSLISPTLSTIAQDRSEIGKVAAQVLIKMIENPEITIKNKVTRIPVELILRDSTKNFNGNGMKE